MKNILKILSLPAYLLGMLCGYINYEITKYRYAHNSANSVSDPDKSILERL